MKKILLSLFTIAAASLAFAQTGSIAIVSIPDEINAGTTVDLEFTYTSTVDVDFTVQLFQTNAGALSPDYSTWVKAVTVEALPASATAAPVVVSFQIPANIPPSSALIDREFTFDLKLTDVTSGTDFGYSNGTANHTVEILPSLTLADNIYFTAPTATSVNPGESLTVEFEYTLSEMRNVKAGLAIYDASGAYVGNAMAGGTEVAVYFSNTDATTTTPVSETATIAIPADITPSSELPGGQVYKVVITIASTSWDYIMDNKNDITVNSPTAVSKAVESLLEIYPNPASDVVNVSYPGKIESIQLHNTNGHMISIDVTSLSNGLFNLNTSTLEKGIYLLTVSTNEGTAVLKLVK